MSKEHTGLPNTPEEIRAFIGKSFSSLQFGQDNEQPHENDTYTLTAHDLISAFQWSEIDAPVSAEPVAHRLLRRNGDGEWVHDAKHWVNGWPPPELIRDCGQTPELYRIEVAYAAPVAALPDVTQQTLDDVMAGIPARDAEIEALRKEIEALQAAPVKPYSLNLDPAGIRALAADAISGALALGYQGVNPPPNNEHWLAPFWEIGRESAAQAQPLDIQPIEITDSMALAFHNAITDGSVGQEDVDDIKTGLRAVFANILDMRPQAQQPVSGADGLAIELQGIAEAIGNGGGFWRSCSGCHESNDGMATGPFSKTLKCHLGVGCSECGGIGAIWDTTDYDAMADFMAAKDQQNVENTETVVCLCNASQGQDADKVDAWRSDDVDLHAALSAEFSKHPQTKPVIGRETLVLRCVRAAIDAARKEQA